MNRSLPGRHQPYRREQDGSDLERAIEKYAEAKAEGTPWLVMPDQSFPTKKSGETAWLGKSEGGGNPDRAHDFNPVALDAAAAAARSNQSRIYVTARLSAFATA